MEIATLEIVPVPTNIRQAVDDLYQAARADIDPSSIAFTCHIGDDVPDQLLADGSHLAQALSNLVNNAIKYTSQGRIHIHVTLDGKDADPIRNLVMIVADTGQGISVDKQSQLFVPFANADQSPGAGIGLTVAKGLAQKMGGDITVTSREGRGSEFTMVTKVGSITREEPNLSPVAATFVIDPAPATKKEESELKKAAQHVEPAETEFDLFEFDEDGTMITDDQVRNENAPIQEETVINPRQGFSRQQDRRQEDRRQNDKIAPDQLSGLNVLIVEDIPANQEILRSLLEPVGCQVSCAGHGQVALNMMENQVFDAILMDIRMPILDGIETTIAIRKTPGPHQNVAIIALTADASAENNADCLAAGADVFLTKPVVVSELFSSIRYARRKQARQVKQAISA